MIDSKFQSSFEIFVDFRLNLDDWAIFLSKQKLDRYQIDLLNDYICIINGGAFEIKLSFNELIENVPMVKHFAELIEMNCFIFQKDPLIDIRIACNIIHIRSCSDSTNALIELLKYVLTNGDLPQPTPEISRSSIPVERKKQDRPVRILNNEVINNEQLTNEGVKIKCMESNEMLLDALQVAPQQQRISKIKFFIFVKINGLNLKVR
jgi:hypothetical protein